MQEHIIVFCGYDKVISQSTFMPVFSIICSLEPDTNEITVVHCMVCLFAASFCWYSFCPSGSDGQAEITFGLDATTTTNSRHGTADIWSAVP